MNQKVKLNDFVDEKLDELCIDVNKVRVLYDKEAKRYAKKIGLNFFKRNIDLTGYTDLDSFLKNKEKPLVVLIFKSRKKLVYATIAHELKHVEQILNGKVDKRDKNVMYQCEEEAYTAGYQEAKKRSKWLALKYQLRQICSLLEYKLTL